jgi:hypothetical protein
MELTSLNTPSAVCTIEIDVSEFFTAWFNPEICVRIRSEIIRSAGPSAAELILKPEDNRFRLLFVSSIVLFKYLKELIEAELWLTRMASSLTRELIFGQ